MGNIPVSHFNNDHKITNFLQDSNNTLIGFCSIKKVKNLMNYIRPPQARARKRLQKFATFSIQKIYFLFFGLNYYFIPLLVVILRHKIY